MSPAAATETCRGEGAKITPMASAPSPTARRASASLVIPQNLTNGHRPATERCRLPRGRPQRPRALERDPPP